jgi:probable rRNA maturation factor
MPPPNRNVNVDCSPKVEGLPEPIVRRAVDTVLDGEGAEAAEFSVTFLSGQRMRALNRRLFDKDKATDVIAFGLPHPDVLVGDIYICPSVVRRVARELRLPERQELIRMVVHGTLHSIGYDHSAGEGRYRSKMWSLQEDYVTRVVRGIE